jgi:hypothetical protein
MINLQLQPSKPRSSSQSITISKEIQLPLHNPSSTLLLIAEIIPIIITARNRREVNRHDNKPGDFRSEEWEGDDPEYNSEDVETEDSPVVVCCWCCGGGYYDVDCYNNGCDGLYDIYRLVDVFVECGVG